MKSEDENKKKRKKFHIYIIFCIFASVINHQTMIYPSVGQYTEAIKLAEQSPEDYFATKTTLRPVLGADGNPVMSSGNFAVVFKMQDQNDGKIYALKCFTRDQECRNESYRLIADELQYVESEYLTKIQYLENELFVDTGTDDTEFPVLLMDWVEGETLDKYIKNHLNEQACLNLLVGRFGIFADWLLKQPFAHGDLKPDNIIVKDDGSLVIVDYDGMYVPKMRGLKARELGSPDFRHPQRTEDDFDEHIDDFAIVTLLLTIKAIALNPNILEDCNAKDCVLLHTQDFSNLAQSAVNQKLQELIGDSEFARLYAVFVVVLAEKILEDDVKVLFLKMMEKVDLNELEYQYAEFLFNNEIDFKKAYSIFERLSAKNHIEAQISAAKCLLYGDGCKANRNKGFMYLSYLAELGCRRAQFELGECYYLGYIIKKNYKKAIKWYVKAAKQGDSLSQNIVGLCYYEGKGVEPNYKQAVEYFTKAVEQEQFEAQFNLGWCYENGQGVSQDFDKAIDLYKKVEDKAKYKMLNFDSLISQLQSNCIHYDEYGCQNFYFVRDGLYIEFL